MSQDEKQILANILAAQRENELRRSALLAAQQVSEVREFVKNKPPKHGAKPCEANLTEKQCITCKQVKPIRYFREDKRYRANFGKVYFAVVCRECQNFKHYQKDDITKSAQILRTYYQTDKAKGRAFDIIEPEWFCEHIRYKPCHWCGRDEKNCGADRIDNSIGHTKQNIIPACEACNKIRQAIPFDIFTRYIAPGLRQALCDGVDMTVYLRKRY